MTQHEQHVLKTVTYFGSLITTFQFYIKRNHILLTIQIEFAYEGGLKLF